MEHWSLGELVRYTRALRAPLCPVSSMSHHPPVLVIVTLLGVHSITVALHLIHRQMHLHPGHPASVCISVKAGGMRIVQKHPHTGDGKEERDKDDQEWESTR
jgi:hypothetical protein